MNTARHGRRQHRRPAVTSIALLLFLTFAVAAAGSGLLVRWSRDDATAASPPAAEATSGTIPNATGALAQATDPDPSVRVTATGSRVQFLIDSGEVPRTVTVILDLAGSGRPLQRQVRLTTAREAVVFTDVPAGTATWTVRSADAEDVRGVVTVPGAGSPDVSTTSGAGTTAAGGPVAPAPGSSATASTDSGSGTASSGGGSTTPAAPVVPPKQPSTPKPAAPPKTPKPSKPPVTDPEPTGPASPYDPDDH